MFLLSIVIAGFMAVSSQMAGITNDTADQAAPEKSTLIEMVDPWEFVGVMDDYEYDLYRQTPEGREYVPPPAYDYVDPVEMDYPVLRQLAVATDQINPASRETTLILSANATNFFVGQPMVILWAVQPATKTVILEGGTATATVEIWPEAVDAYIAVRNVRKEYFFLNAFSCIEKKFFRYPVCFGCDTAIPSTFGIVSLCWIDSAYPNGQYTLFGVLVPPGTDVRDNKNWISNLAYTFFKIGIFGNPQ